MKNLLKLFIVPFGITSLLLSSCDDNTENGDNSTQAPINILLSDTEFEIASDGINFAMDFFSTVHTQNEKKENIVLSPLSLNMALAMVWNGADGETQKAIQKAMGMANYPKTEVNDYFKKLRESIVKTDPTTKLALANSIWYKNDFPVNEDFILTNKNWYNAEVKEIDFSAPSAPDQINQWCSDNTNGLIKEIIDEIPGDAVMYLLNALYFKGEWSKDNKFSTSKTNTEQFRKEDGNTVRAQMMNQRNELDYYSDEYLSMVTLPYGNNAFSMLFILPNENVSFSTLSSQLKQAGYWESCLRSRSLYNVDLFVPKFKIEYEIQLNETLEQLGMRIAFDSSLADFSSISETKTFISKVKQKAFIEVDEKGSEAAAVTVNEMLTTSGTLPSIKEATFRADRPFMFAIQENSTGTVLFIGKIGSPE